MIDKISKKQESKETFIVRKFFPVCDKTILLKTRRNAGFCAGQPRKNWSKVALRWK